MGFSHVEAAGGSATYRALTIVNNDGAPLQLATARGHPLIVVADRKPSVIQ